MEIYTDGEGGIVLRKYSPIGEMGNVAVQYAESLAQVSGHIVAITDRDSVIAATGPAKREYMGRRISKKLEQIMMERQVYETDNTHQLIPVADTDGDNAGEQLIWPVICEGDVIGSVIIMTREKGKILTEIEKKLAHLASNYLGKRMEV